MINTIKKLREYAISYYNSYNLRNKIIREKRVRASFRVEKAFIRSKNEKEPHRKDKTLVKRSTANSSSILSLNHYVALIASAITDLVRWLLMKLYNLIRCERSRSRCSTDLCMSNDSNWNALDHEELLDHVLFIGIDCEMVGVGKAGEESMLARCSCCCFADKSRSTIRILFDKFVKPTKAVTDYRTEFSGVTAAMLKRKDGSVITFEQCRNYVLQLLSSTSDGRVVVCVGHGLVNDFQALKIQHPKILTRDTSLYPPFMKAVRSKRYRRKLSALAEEHLGLEIQNASTISALSTFVVNKNDAIIDEALSESNNLDASPKEMLGHSSVEDSAAALLLYSKVSYEWEKSLNFPLRRYLINRTLAPSNEKNHATLYIDGCNVPIGLRKRKNYDDYPTSLKNDSTKYQLISTLNSTCLVDWVPIIRSIVLHPVSFISTVMVMYDGAAFKNNNEPNTGLHTLYHPSLLSEVSSTAELSACHEGGIYLHISEKDTSVDDIIVDRCKSDFIRMNQEETNPNRMSSLMMNTIPKTNASEVYDYFETLVRLNANQHQGRKASWYAVVTRKGVGGTRTKRQVFEKLNLRRPHEGALCLFPCIWPHFPRQSHQKQYQSSFNSISLEEDAFSTLEDLKNISKVDQLLEFQLRPLQMLRSIVVTNDVLLADRVVKGGGAVLSYRQFEQALLY